MSHVIVLLAEPGGVPLNPALVAEVAGRLGAPPRWLAEGEAAEIAVGDGDAAHAHGEAGVADLDDPRRREPVEVLQRNIGGRDESLGVQIVDKERPVMLGNELQDPRRSHLVPTPDQ